MSVESPGEVAHAGLRGAIAAMAMTGMRNFTVNVGIVEQTPPDAILRKRANERVGLAADQLLYGFVLSETRARPQE